MRFVNWLCSFVPCRSPPPSRKLTHSLSQSLQHRWGMPETRNSWLSARPRPSHTHTQHTPQSRLTAVLFTAEALMDGKVGLFTYAHTHTQWGRSSWFGPKVLPPGDKSCREQCTCCTTTKLPIPKKKKKWRHQGCVLQMYEQASCLAGHHISCFWFGLAQMGKNPSLNPSHWCIRKIIQHISMQAKSRGCLLIWGGGL